MGLGVLLDDSLMFRQLMKGPHEHLAKQTVTTSSSFGKLLNSFELAWACPARVLRTNLVLDKRLPTSRNETVTE